MTSKRLSRPPNRRTYRGDSSIRCGDPLRRLREASDTLARLLRDVTCEAERTLGLGCDQAQRLVLLGTAMRGLGAAFDTMPAKYRAARDRAQSLLAEQKVALPAYPTQRH